MPPTISELFKVPSVSAAALPTMGVEVEIEWPSSPAGNHPSNLTYWDIVEDGSLRYGGVEYVSIPLFPQMWETAMSELNEAIKGYDVHPTAGARCSVHCHINFSSLIPEQVLSFIMGWVLYESFLYTASGKSRYTNTYSPGMSSCYSQVEQLSRLYRYTGEQDYLGFSSIAAGFEKYAGLNIGSLSTFGTVEARSHEGTTDTLRILDWMGVLGQLYSYTVDKTAMEVLQLAGKDEWQNVFPNSVHDHPYFLHNLCNATAIASLAPPSRRRRTAPPVTEDLAEMFRQARSTTVSENFLHTDTSTNF